MPFYDRDIDWIILSHPDRDHLTGLLAVLQNYHIHNILWSGIPKDSAEYTAWRELISQEGANIVISSTGDTFDLGGNPDIRLEVLAPPSQIVSNASNEESVVIRLIYGARSFIFTGDVDNAEEQKIIDNIPDCVLIFKIAHHGSKYSANDEFYTDLLPAAAVISVGAQNSYGHPAPAVLEKLQNMILKY